MDLAGAKDIRLYSIQDWFKQIGEGLLRKEDRLLKDIARRQLLLAVISALLIFLRDGVAYILLIHKVIQGEVCVSNFLVYFTMISTFANWISGLLTTYNNLELQSKGFSHYRAYLEMPSYTEQTGGLSALPRSSGRAAWSLGT